MRYKIKVYLRESKRGKMVQTPHKKAVTVWVPNSQIASGVETLKAQTKSTPNSKQIILQDGLTRDIEIVGLEEKKISFLARVWCGGCAKWKQRALTAEFTKV